MVVHIVKGPFSNTSGKILKVSSSKSWYKVLIKLFSSNRSISVHKNEIIIQN